MAERGGEAVTVGTFDSVAAAAKKIAELEGYTSYGVFFDIFVEIGPGAHSEHEAFGHLEHTGKHSRRCYLVKRVQH